jgi:hypothetical protein
MQVLRPMYSPWRASVPGFLHNAGAEALKVLDVRQDDLVSGANPPRRQATAFQRREPSQ